MTFRQGMTVFIIVICAILIFHPTAAYALIDKVFNITDYSGARATTSAVRLIPLAIMVIGFLYLFRGARGKR